MPEYAIELDDITKSFGEKQALSGVTFRMPAGTVLGVLGPNGAGKTTTINVLSTLIRPTSGSAKVAGYDVVTQAAQVRKSIGLTGQYAAIDEMLTGRENLVLFGELNGLTRAQARARADELLEAFSLTEAGGRRVGTYSGGMRRRADIACGLVAEPAVVFLDEPTTGLDPRSRREVWDLVSSLTGRGTSVLLTTQYLDEADALSDSIVVIDHGRVIAEGTADELKERVGGSFCQVTPVHTADGPRIAQALSGLGDVSTDPDTGALSIPAPGGLSTLSEVFRRLEALDIEVGDIALRKPSLDEVFFTLTAPAP
ncbi:ATP-binding cassette domain-containing protein [Mycobacterium frederiksbergense]|uniref:ATP-binding cassette domain-containing protein n=1 Tax=Mycolicibacterium frederiksbergense TaxID=117567 RepID=A0A6H0S1M1_9MYCO|nr:ATP-binding cassette domain-containing protein [Mycolicibacterium frederiksbergense]MCV7043750.1 ATP-binding cassette domain-containing protein [Mycolicibacterium frederiksbergense]QIV81258.1 ATP-binding cassette domain-containing protein [Mycolicibacterium frederiksbergense]